NLNESRVLGIALAQWGWVPTGQRVDAGSGVHSLGVRRKPGPLGNGDHAGCDAGADPGDGLDPAALVERSTSSFLMPRLRASSGLIHSTWGWASSRSESTLPYDEWVRPFVWCPMHCSGCVPPLL